MAAAVVALLLAISIPVQVESHLVQEDTDSLRAIAAALNDEELIPPTPDDPASLAALDRAVRLNLLGSGTVRVKVWAPDGTIVYSDVTELIGRSFELTDHLRTAFAGTPLSRIPDLTGDEAVSESDLPPVREYYLPVEGADGEVIAVFEAYQLNAASRATVASIRRHVWLSVALGIGLLSVFTASLVVQHGRSSLRQQRQAERLFRELVHAQTRERQRIVGALHDDIGQPLYRIHYGLEACRSRVPDGPIAEELARVDELVLSVDRTLRAELRSLHDGAGQEVSLRTALESLIDETERETDLTVSLVMASGCKLDADRRTALYRAVREGLTNIRKHADASSVEIRLGRTNGKVRLDVDDDGIGTKSREQLGLSVARERLDVLGGGLRVTRRPEGGTRLSAWVPADPEDDRS